MLTFSNQIYIYQLCIANAPILTAKGFLLKQSNFYNQKLIGHPQWESNPRPPGDFTRHYKLWKWHFQLHDFEYWFSGCRCFFGKYQHTEMLIAIQVFAVEIIFDRCIRINRVVQTRRNVAWYIGIAGHHDTMPQIRAAPILSHKIRANTKETHCIIVGISCVNICR